MTDGVMILRRMLGRHHPGREEPARSDADVVLAIDALKPRLVSTMIAARRCIAGTGERRRVPFSRMWCCF